MSGASDWLISRVGRREAFDLDDLRELADDLHGGSLPELLRWLEGRARDLSLTPRHRARIEADIATLRAAFADPVADADIEAMRRRVIYGDRSPIDNKDIR